MKKRLNKEDKAVVIVAALYNMVPVDELERIEDEMHRYRICALYVRTVYHFQHVRRYARMKLAEVNDLYEKAIAAQNSRVAA